MRRRRDNFGYDAAGNLTADGSTLTYDATSHQVAAVLAGYWNLQHAYDGDTLRVKKVEDGVTTYYLRSSVLGGQVVAEINSAGQWAKGFVYDQSGQLLTIQQASGNRWTHQDPFTKSQRLTDAAGAVTAGIDLDPWGGETSRTWNGNQQTRKYTTYDRNVNGRDEAMMRSYHAWFARFDQPDPWDGSYDLTNPQSFNRYSYTQNDPVNFVDPSGLDDEIFDPGEVITINTSTSRWPTIPISLGTGFPAYDLMPDPEAVGGGEPPQNTPGQRDLPSLISDTRNIIENASGECAKLLGKNALRRFDAIASNTEFNGDFPVRVEGLDGGVREGKLSDVPPTSAVTDPSNNRIYLNPNGYAFGKFSNFPALGRYFAKIGAANQREFALATIIHEFLHTTGRFKPDSKIGLNGKIDSKQSEKYQKEVLKKCFPKR